LKGGRTGSDDEGKSSQSSNNEATIAQAKHDHRGKRQWHNGPPCRDQRGNDDGTNSANEAWLPNGFQRDSSAEQRRGGIRRLGRANLSSAR